MNEGRHEVVININASPEQIWAALTDPQQTRLFWHGALNHSTWQPGAPWTSESDEGELYLDGEIVEVDQRLRMSRRRWSRSLLMPQTQARDCASSTPTWARWGYRTSPAPAAGSTSWAP